METYTKAALVIILGVFAIAYIIYAIKANKGRSTFPKPPIKEIK